MRERERERERDRERTKLMNLCCWLTAASVAERLSGTMGGRESKPVEVLP